MSRTIATASRRAASPRGPDVERLMARAERAHRRGELARGLASAGRAVRAARRASDPVALVRSLNLVGVIGKELGHLRRSEASYRRALPVALRHLGPSHPGVAAIYHNLGGILFARGQLARAERWTRRAVAIRRRALGRRHPETVADEACLAVILAARGEARPAEVIYRRAIRFFSSRRGGAYEVAVNASNLAVLLEGTGRVRAAEAAHRRAFAAYASMQHPPAHDVALTRLHLGLLRARLGRSDGAALVDEAHQALRRALGPAHPWTRAARRRWIDLRAGRAP